MQHALDELPASDRGQLTALIRPLDAEYRRKTTPDPHAYPNLPWWRRRYTELYHGRKETS